jgi:hypothetical protein
MAASSAVTYYGYVIFGGDAAYLVRDHSGRRNDSGYWIGNHGEHELHAAAWRWTARRFGAISTACWMSATDTSLASGGPGIMAYGGNNANTYVTTWTASDLAAAAASIMPAAFGRELHARSHANLRR